MNGNKDYSGGGKEGQEEKAAHHCDFLMKYYKVKVFYHHQAFHNRNYCSAAFLL